MSIADTIAEGIDAMRKVIQAARAAPDLTQLPPNPLKAIVNAAFVAAVLVFANRALMYPETIGNLTKVGVSAILAAGSILFVFVISLLISVARTDGAAEGIADRWSVLLAFVWLITLLLFLVDQLLGSHIGFVIKDLFGGLLYRLDRGRVFQYLFYAIVAFLVLLIRTRRLEKKRLPVRWCVLAFLIVTPVAVAMLYVFMINFDN